jgi:protein-S-isoprenylcysteine O-methyltransferase Ste14
MAAGAFIFFSVGLTSFFDTPANRPLWVRTLHRLAMVMGLANVAGVVLFPPLADGLAVLGAAMYSVAIAVFLAAIEAAKRTRLQRAFIDRPLPDRLITDGPFRWVRHPFYSGYLIGAVAAPLVTGRWELMVVAAGIVLFCVLAARHEERVWLASPKGAEYREYQRTAGMFVPFISRR